MGFFDALGTLADVVTGGSDMGLGTALSGVADSISGSALAAGATLAGSVMNNNTAMSIANQNNAFSASQASSIYSRGAQDLANAGINPMLAYGSPAAMAQFSTPNIQPSLSLAAGAYSSAKDVNSRAVLNTSTAGAIDAKLSPEIAQMQSHSAAMNADAALTSAKTVTETKRPEQVVAETGATSAMTARTKVDTLKSIEETKLSKLQQALVDKQTTVAQAQRYLTEAQTAVQKAIETRTVSENVGQQVKNQLDSADLIIKNKRDVPAVLGSEDSAVIGQALHNALKFIPFVK